MNQEFENESNHNLNNSCVVDDRKPRYNAPSNHSRRTRRSKTIINNSSGRGAGQGGRQSFVRQDSGLSLDCSDHSGISFHSGVSSISSVSLGPRRSHHSHSYNNANNSSSSNNNLSNHNLSASGHHQHPPHHPDHHQPSSSRNNSRQEMYYRQDSEHSFSSASSIGASSYSSEASFSVGSQNSNNSKFMHNYKKPVMPPKSQYAALDCEMVGTLTGKSACARVVLIDWKGRTVMDQHVKPTEPITDYRTFVSGITEEDIQDAPTLEEVRPRVQQALAGKILVGHGLSNDLECLGVEHPWHMIRDTALYEPFMKLHYGQLNPRKLKELCHERLNREIQVPNQPHSPAEDALAALDLYKSHRPRWEACMTSQIKEGQRLLIEQQKQREQYEQYFAGLPIIAFPS